MPLPTLIGAGGAAPATSLDATAAKPYIFVAYSHKDAALAEEFLKRFLVSARVIDITEDDIFFDRTRIQAGDEWSPALDQGLARASFFVFLVSWDSLASGCCMQKELATAAKRAIQIVPVILTPCDWKKQQVPGAQKTLDRFNPLPVAKDNEASELLPITKWAHRDEAWVAVTDALCKKLKSMVTLRATIGQAHPASGAHLEIARKILAYRCNQVEATSDFRDGLQQWQQQTLVVLAKGVYDDDLGGFWSRLEFDYLYSMRKVSCAQAISVALPDPAREAIALKELQRLTRNQLREAIERVAGSGVAAPAGQASTCVTPLVALLPSASETGCAKAIAQTLLRTLEEHETPALLQNIALIIHIEDSALHEHKLTQKWGLGKFIRTRVVELRPLGWIADHDVRTWLIELREKQDEDVWLQRLAGLRAVASNNQIRLRKFNQLVNEMLP
jgi:hypothetical protein